ncbi:MAG: S-layer homology domain-containing protein [Chloroflexota bacterium]
MSISRRYLAILCFILLAVATVVAGVWAAHPVEAGTSAAAPTSQEVPAGACGPQFVSWTTPNSGTGNNTLTGVTALAFNNAWAVGFYTDTTSGIVQTLIEQWDGNNWTIVPSPNIGTSDNYLQAIGGRAPGNLWAVGYYRTAAGSPFQTLILHYDGTAWTQSTSPSPGSAENYLYGVALVSPTEAWAVGYYSNTPNLYRSLTLHWINDQWTQVASPNPVLGGSGLRGLVVVSPTEVWAVGAQADITLALRSYVLRWNGTSWSTSTTPSTTGCVLTAVDVDLANPGSLWAAGACQSTTYQTLILRYNGSAWVSSPSPNPGTGDNALGGIVVISPTEAYAVGGYSDGTTTQSLALYWDGTSWRQVASGNPGSSSNQLLSATRVLNSSGVYAVGSQSSGGVAQTLAEFKQVVPCDPTATPGTSTVTPATATSTVVASATSQPATPTGTGTSVPSTATSAPSPSPSPSAGTVTATPTACALLFTDVQEGSTFYPFVRCLSCRGIINGYTTGCETGNPCFRPNNNVTRGQLSKIVSNSAGFADPQATQLFEDVAPGSTFFDFVGRLASRGYMGGYPCGSVGEPCGSGNLPYFRPNANATRGQISKIVANAAGYTDPAGVQIFEDVAPGSTFYDFIQRLAARQIMSGYPCGGVGEPCGSGNLPYFRPNSNATRGQTAKIVGNTFFPGCQTPLR